MGAERIPLLRNQNGLVGGLTDDDHADTNDDRDYAMNDVWNCILWDFLDNSKIEMDQHDLRKKALSFN